MTESGSIFLDRGPLETKKSKSMPMWAKALIALTPALIFLFFFTLFPIVNTIFISFIKDFFFRDGMGSIAILSYFRQLDEATHPEWWIAYWEMADPDVIFITPPIPLFSFQNYVQVLKDPIFLQALQNTFILTIISVPLTIGISLMIAVSLNSIKPLRATYQTIFFLPYVTNAIALGMVFNTLFSHETGGIMNQVVALFGIDPIAWVRDGYNVDGTTVISKFSLGFAITVQTIWTGLAFKILVFMSGLASIDKQYYDAARIDGANRSTILRRITVPLLSPQILYITITSFIGAFKAYQSIIAIVGQGVTHFGGADGTMWITVVGYIYKNRVNEATIPQASAGAVILLLIILLITAVQMQVSKRRIHY